MTAPRLPISPPPRGALPFPDLASRVLVSLVVAWVFGTAALAIGAALLQAVRS